MVSPFYQLGMNAANNFGKGMQRQQDKSAIDEILSSAIASNDPEVLQNSIGQILSKVSPERQGDAINFLEGRYKAIKTKQEEEVKNNELRKAGVNPNFPPALQTEQYKNKNKQDYLSNLGLGQPQAQGQPNQELAPPSQLPQPNEMAATGANFGMAPNVPEQNQGQPQQQGALDFSKLSKDQLIHLTGAPYKEISEPAKAQLTRIESEEKAAKSNFEPEAEKLEAKRVSELATELENEYKAAENEDLRMGRMAHLDEQGNVSTPAMVKILDFFNLPIGVLGNPDTEEYRKLEADFVRDVSKVFPGGKISNYEVQAYMRTIPSLMNTPEGRKAILRNKKLMNEPKKIRYQEYKKILKENNGKKPPNLGILLEERTAERIEKVEDEFINGVTSEVQKFQQPIRMIGPQGQKLDIPPNEIEAALKAGAKFK